MEDNINRQADDFCAGRPLNLENAVFRTFSGNLQPVSDYTIQMSFVDVRSILSLVNTTYYDDRYSNFPQMVIHDKTTKFACSLFKCQSNDDTTYVCTFYDKVQKGEKIYEPLYEIAPSSPEPTVEVTEPTVTECPIDTSQWTETTESTPFTTIVTRVSTSEFPTPTDAFPTTSLATVTPTDEDYPTGTPSPGCTTPSRTTRVNFGSTFAPTEEPQPSTFECDGTGSPLTPSLRQTLIAGHNYYRSELAKGRMILPDGSFASPASNMYKMEYSCELEKVSQEWDNRCVWEHSPPEHRNGGENLYRRITSSPGNKEYAIANSMDLWWNELRQYGGITRTNVTLTMDNFNLGIGHWSQMAWGSSREIGCGYQECPQANNNKTMMLVVCHYRPRGNILGKEIYQIGHPCARDSDCTTYTRSKCDAGSGLCYVY